MTSRKQPKTTTIPARLKGVVQFEPCASPLSRGRGLTEEKPTFTLRRPDSIYVYGAEDCRDFGIPNTTVRLNAFERYDSEEYLDLLKVQWLHLFAAYRGNSEAIAPTGVLSVPISVYRNPDEVNALRKRVVGKHQIEDLDGCVLRVEIDSNRLLVLPEGVGALYHYAYDHKTALRRADADANGNVLVVDIGYLTTDESLYINMKYQGNRAYTEPDLGMSRIVNEVQRLVRESGRDVELSQIDAGLRVLVDPEGRQPVPLEGEKHILIAGGYKVDIGPVYNTGVPLLAQAIRDSIFKNYKEAVALVILTGGGALHTYALLNDLLPFPVVLCPNPAEANVLGAYTRLMQQAQDKQAETSLLWAADLGNGRAKGVSTSTLNR